MASVDPNLYLELRNKYPELPDNVVTSCMIKFGYDRIKCMETLTLESPKYLYGRSSPGTNNIVNFGESTVETRPRSDSSGSIMSDASSSSAPARPPYHTSFSNVPGFRGPITIPDHERTPPTSAPVRPSDINQFIAGYGGNNSPIPQIGCINNNMRAGHDGQKSNYGLSLGHLPSRSSPTQPNKPALRHIEVQHIETNMEHVEQPPPSYTYQIKIDRCGYTGGNNAERGGWTNHHVNHYKPASSNINLQNNPQKTPFPSDLQISQFDNMNLVQSGSSRFKSPTEEYVQGYGTSKPNQSSLAIYLRSPNPQTNLEQSPTVERTVFSPLPGPYPGRNSALSDPRISPGYVRNMPVSPNIHDYTNSQNPHGSSRPIIVEIRRDGVQSQIQYFNEMASGSNSGGHSLAPPGGSTVIGSSGQICDNVMSGEQGQTVINIKGISPSHEEVGFLKFPPMPNVCRVPGHPLLYSSDRDTSFHGERDYRQNQRPFISPTSSQSSVSSESSAVINTNHPHPGHYIQDESEEYTHALLSHQNSRMQKLKEDLSAAEERLQQLKNEVSNLQLSASDRQRKITSPFPSAVDLTKLRGENLQLQADIQLMTREIDMYNNGQTPLGVLDALEEQDFYKFPNTGQRGSIYASSGEPHPTKVFMSTVTPSVTTSGTPSLPHSQRLPPEIPVSVPPTIPPRVPKELLPPPIPPRVEKPQIHVPPPPPHQPQVGSGDSDADGEQWSCSACTFLNHPALNKCECCEMPRMNFSLASSPRDVPDTYPSSLQVTQSP